MPSPLPSNGTRSPQRGLPMAVRSKGREVVGNRVCIGKVLIQWFPVKCSSECTQSKEDTDPNCPGVCDSRLRDNALSLGSCVRSGRLSEDDILNIS